ncbi:zinc ribbon domain-containing protein [uncultured Sunxiuqinia sp.]|uniref:zinc ribbon domain-containing protein n=1 Tax=uncultured Sunxiuqinia sp. TaxID=1573825 RepID=UPI002AA8B70E|nr:zinc ribbon domain-containing protein [uncultured Sunxiuqinia sp.]
MKSSYSCVKCGSKKASVDVIRTTGAGFIRFFNIQNRKFKAVSCERCGYTEFYKTNSKSGAGDVLDFLAN